MSETGYGFAVRVATVGPLGYFPVAPGMAGSAGGIVLIAVLHHLLPAGGSFCAVTAAVVAAIYGIGVWAAGKAERYFGATDPSKVVIDEVAGQMIVFLLRPSPGWAWLACGFVLFRILDVVKPFPARRAEHLPSGWGIMTDDVIAGAYGALLLLLLARV